MKIITLIGSSRFKKKFHEVGWQLERQGVLVLVMSFFGHADEMPITPEERKLIQQADEKRIDLSDEVLVINEEIPVCVWCDNPVESNSYCSSCKDWAMLKRRHYYGEHTQHEIDYALAKQKPVYYLYPITKDV